MDSSGYQGEREFRPANDIDGNRSFANRASYSNGLPRTAGLIDPGTIISESGQNGNGAEQLSSLDRGLVKEVGGAYEWEFLQSKAERTSSEESGTEDKSVSENSYMEIPSVRLYRKNIDIGGEDKYGHWWVEIDGTESYGWWPKNPVDLEGTIFGVDGELNGQTMFGGTPTIDPHHGDRGDGVNVFSVFSRNSELEVKTLIREFAESYSGDWSWPIGQNCHSFQEDLRDHADLLMFKVYNSEEVQLTTE